MSSRSYTFEHDFLAELFADMARDQLNMPDGEYNVNIQSDEEGNITVTFTDVKEIN